MPACWHLGFSASRQKFKKISLEIKTICCGMECSAVHQLQLECRTDTASTIQGEWSQEQYANWLPYTQRLKNPINHRTVNNLIYYCSWLYENLWFLSRESHLSSGIYSQFMIFYFVHNALCLAKPTWAPTPL